MAHSRVKEREQKRIDKVEDSELDSEMRIER